MTAVQNEKKKPHKFILGPRYHIVIIGANFAGMMAASAFSDDFKVTVIDSRPYFEFLPNIHELISGIKKPDNLRLHRKSLIQGFGHRFCHDYVENIDGEKNRVYTSSGKKFYFDFCIVAIGGVNNTFGVKGADQFTLPFKSVKDCHLIGQKIKKLSKSDHGMKIVIVGGGLEGIEALGEILRKYRTIPGLNIELIEKSPRLLPGTTSSLDNEIRRLCERYHVSFRTGVGVEKVTNEKIHLSSGEILGADITIWTGGAAAPKLLYQSGLSNNPGEWAPVCLSLQSQLRENIFIVGDAAAFPSPLKKQAYYAMDMGILATKNIHHIVNGTNAIDFKPFPRPSLITFGDLSTFLITDSIALAGPALASVKESIFQLTMLRLDKPTRLAGLFDTAFRAISGARAFVFPTLTSFSALKRMGQLKVLN
jgi:NADH dehydrogenase FAD-containing subunit